MAVLKGKILCLHGFTQSGSIFSSKSGGLRKLLTKNGYETIFLTSPIKLTPADLPFEVSEVEGADYRAWWLKDPITGEYSIEQAISAIKDCIEEQGPFVGLIGFSQGAALSGILSERFNSIFPQNQDALAFGIYYSGFKVNLAQYEHYYKPAIRIPTLHIIGELDTVVDESRCMELYNVCDELKRTLLKHPGGHFVPNSKDSINKVVNWISGCTEPKIASIENTAEKKMDMNDLDDLMSGFGGV